MNEAPREVRLPRLPRRHALWLGVGVLLLAGGLRLWGLGDKGLWLDEVMSLRLATMPTFGAMVREAAAYDAHPPLYAAVEFLWLRPQPMRWVSPGVIDWGGRPRLDLAGLARGPSVLFGLGAVAVMVLLASRLYGRGLGLLAGGVLAVSAYHVYFSQEGRPYALVVLLTLALTYALVRLLESRERVAWGWWAAYALLAVLCLYTYVLTALVLLAHALIYLAGWLELHLKERRAAKLNLAAGLGAGVVVALVFAPWLPYLAARGRTMEQILATTAPPPLRAGDLFGAFREWVFGPVAMSGADLALMLLAIAMLLTAAAAAWRRGRRTVLLLLGLIVLPAALYLALPIPRVHEFESKHLIFVFPPCLLLLVGALRNRGWRIIAGGILAAVVLVNAGELAVYLSSDYQREPWPEVAAEIEQAGRPGDVVVVNPGFAAFAARYYYRGSLPLLGVPLPPGPFLVDRLTPLLAQAQVRRVILVDCMDRVSRPFPDVDRFLAGRGRATTAVRFKGRLGWIDVVVVEIGDRR